jgi:hypothetical protein
LQISASTSDEVIQFDPPELRFPLVPDKKVLSSVKIINITDFNVSFILNFAYKNRAMYFRNSTAPIILPPRSTHWLTLTREENKDAVKYVQFNDEINLLYVIVAEDITPSDLDRYDHTEKKKLPIVLMKVSLLFRKFTN